MYYLFVGKILMQPEPNTYWEAGREGCEVGELWRQSLVLGLLVDLQ